MSGPSHPPYIYQVQLGIWSFPTGRTPGLDLDLV